MVQADPAAAHRVLVVEDDPDSAELIARACARCGYTTMSAADATAMQSAIRNWQPDVITLDLCLPNIDGLEVISAIKDTGFTGPVIIVSGQAEWIREFTSKAAIECGLNIPAHMEKPVDLRRLRQLLTSVRGSLPSSSSGRRTP
jgi:CheY-like chemotaxis protein